MARVLPMRFQRLAEAFELGARVRHCQSSGSKHSPESPTDLSNLVNSFIERDGFFGGEVDDEVNFGKQVDMDNFEDGYSSESETRDKLKSLMQFDEDDVDKLKIYRQVERACSLIGDRSAPDFKRRLMARLRQNGLDAGLCKSKWEKDRRLPAGDYEYIDVNIGKTRYIIEVLIAGEFKIARPTDHYISLLDDLPPILVIKKEELKKVLRLICKAIKKSMKMRKMHLPPWREYRYMEAKWFSSYKRTTNPVSTKSLSDSSENLPEKMRSVGFFPLPPVNSNYCREDFGSKRTGSRVGNLAVAINGTTTIVL